MQSTAQFKEIRQHANINKTGDETIAHQVKVNTA